MDAVRQDAFVISTTGQFFTPVISIAAEAFTLVISTGVPACRDGAVCLLRFRSASSLSRLLTGFDGRLAADEAGASVAGRFLRSATLQSK